MRHIARTAAAGLLCASLAACGSTVQVRGQSTTGMTGGADLTGGVVQSPSADGSGQPQIPSAGGSVDQAGGQATGVAGQGPAGGPVPVATGTSAGPRLGGSG